MDKRPLTQNNLQTLRSSLDVSRQKVVYKSVDKLGITIPVLT